MRGVAGEAARGARLRRSAWVALPMSALVFAGCSRALHAPTPTVGAPQVGIASWYGPGFHGRRTSTGEIYDQHALTAAHPTLPLGTRARVTSLDNGRSVDVRINDRGPFVGRRVLDLSYGAAQSLDLVRAGTGPVRIEVIERPPGGASHVLYAVQVGAFGERTKAQALRDDLAQRYADVYIAPVQTRLDRLYRVRVGPYTIRRDAERRAVELADRGLPAVVTEEPRP